MSCSHILHGRSSCECRCDLIPSRPVTSSGPELPQVHHAVRACCPVSGAVDALILCCNVFSAQVGCPFPFPARTRPVCASYDATRTSESKIPYSQLSGMSMPQIWSNWSDGTDFFSLQSHTNPTPQCAEAAPPTILLARWKTSPESICALSLRLPSNSPRLAVRPRVCEDWRRTRAQ